MIKILRQINTSAAIIVLVCFFLPWVQVSCAGSRDTLSGVDLARDGHGLLWFVPVLMGALILSAIVRIRREQNKAFALASALCGLVTAYLMNHERLRAHDESGLIAAQLTGWFWLGLFSSLAIVISGLILFVRGKRSPAGSA